MRIFLVIVGLYALAALYSAAPSNLEVTSSPIKGLSYWCTLTRKKAVVPAPPQCCTEKYKCNKYINPKKKKYGIENKHNYRIRLCSCEIPFRKCMDEHLKSSVSDLLNVHTLKLNETCLYKTKSNTYNLTTQSQYNIENSKGVDTSEIEYNMNDLSVSMFMERLFASGKKSGIRRN